MILQPNEAQDVADLAQSLEQVQVAFKLLNHFNEQVSRLLLGVKGAIESRSEKDINVFGNVLSTTGSTRDIASPLKWMVGSGYLVAFETHPDPSRSNVFGGKQAGWKPRAVVGYSIRFDSMPVFIVGKIFKRTFKKKSGQLSREVFRSKIVQRLENEFEKLQKLPTKKTVYGPYSIGANGTLLETCVEIRVIRADRLVSGEEVDRLLVSPLVAACGG